MLVIGIDPGSRYTGYGIVRKKGTTLEHVTSGRINATGAKVFIDRLEIIYRGISGILDEWKPEQAAVESIFMAKNAMSSLKLGHARGVSLLALQHAQLDLHEYPPASVKQAVTGQGRATKEQMQRMVRLVLSLSVDPVEDAADALAVAICHCQAHDFKRRLQA
ncbi:MAG: crossover junction endodeoxyribonuclease RuvC [Bradymonadaceae bacterium]|nr:crossover junction endodeoxyribonuclease RuvC [Lujinxingiaceae bacterium]